MQKYIVTEDVDMLAPKWLADRINYKTIKFVRVVIDGAETLKGVKINNEVAQIGDVVLFDGRKLFVERR